MLEKLASASAWVLPYGSVSQGGLGFLSQLLDRESRPPMIIQTNGEGAKGGICLSSHCAFLRPDDQIVAACSAEKRLLREAFPGFPGIHALPLAVSPVFRPFSARERADFRRKVAVSAREKMLVYAGRLSAQKNVHLLLESFVQVRKTHPRSRLFLLGDADTLGKPHLRSSAGRGTSKGVVSYATYLAGEVARLGLESSVVFWGPASQEELAAFLASCDAHVSLSAHFGEDFGYSIAQGLAAGAPTAVTHWGGGIDFILGAGAEAIPVRLSRDHGPQVDAGDAARAILKVLEPSGARGYRKKALEFAESTLAPKAVARALREITRQAVEVARHAPGRASKRIPLPSPQTRLFLASQRQAFEAQSTGSGGTPLFESAGDPEFKRICRAYVGIPATAPRA